MDPHAMAESAFDVAYLMTVWWLVVAMARHQSNLAPENRRVGRYMLAAFTLLAIGDTAHVGFRVVAYAHGGLGQSASLLMIGTFATSITMTLFYVFMVLAWQARFRKPYGLAGWILFGAAAVRLIAVLGQAGNWGNMSAPNNGSLALSRNLPLFVLGIGTLVLMWTDANRTGDKLFRSIAQLILGSFAFYTPVIMLYTRWPGIGVLMVPKTMAYLAIAALAYRNLYGPPSTTAL